MGAAHWGPAQRQWAIVSEAGAALEAEAAQLAVAVNGLHGKVLQQMILVQHSHTNFQPSNYPYRNSAPLLNGVLPRAFSQNSLRQGFWDLCRAPACEGVLAQERNSRHGTQCKMRGAHPWWCLARVIRGALEPGAPWPEHVLQPVDEAGQGVLLSQEPQLAEQILVDGAAGNQRQHLAGHPKHLHQVGDVSRA